MTKQTCGQINGNSVRPPATYTSGIDVADIGVIRFAVRTCDVCTDVDIARTCCWSRTSVRADRGILIAAGELTERCITCGCIPVAMQMNFHRVITKRCVEEAITLARERLKADSRIRAA